jgi:SRSO17 transposase
LPYEPIFRNRTKTFFDKAELHTKGIVQSQLRNIERISEDLNASYHLMQHFITESNWDERAVIEQVSREVSSIFPKRKLTGLIIDKSVGVGWQYCGNVGKISNSQVAVFACLSNGDFASMVDARLYLPEQWCDDLLRCCEARIPEGNRVFRTKLELATQIIEQQVENGISFDYIGADGYYSNDVNLARAIDQMGYLYMLDIHSDQKIHLNRPELFLPQRKSTKGPAPKRLKATTPDMTVSEYMESLEPGDWEKIEVRNTAKGKLTGDYHFVRVFIWNKGINQIESRMLVIRKIMSAKNTVEIKYSFTNANLEQYTHQALAYMQAQRYFVEHCI